VRSISNENELFDGRSRCAEYSAGVEDRVR